MNYAVPYAFILALFLASLSEAGVILGVHAEPDDDRDRDRYDGEPAEWEKQVAQDARGDVLVEWPGSIDLLYMTLGTLHSVQRGESYLLMRIGYNITETGQETIVQPEDTPTSFIPDVPRLSDPAPLAMINVSFNVSQERTERLSLWTENFGGTWMTNQGLLVANNPTGNDDMEVIYAAPLRRFGLEDGDLLDDYNVTSYRNDRMVDSMDGFHAANDYMPNYIPVHPLLSDPQQNVPPLPLPPGTPPPPPLPDPPDPPDPVPEPPEPTDHIPNRPYPEPPSPGTQGIPRGMPHPDDLKDWDPDRDGPLPWNPRNIIDGATDPESGQAWSTAFEIKESTSRFLVRSHQQVLHANLDDVGFANFTVENLMTETDQQVGMFLVGHIGMRWHLRYGLDMPDGVRTLPADSTATMSLIAAPESLFSRPQWGATAIFISDWGGIEVLPLIFQSTEPRMELPTTPERGLILPNEPRIRVLNPESEYRVNERRQILVQVRDDETGQWIAEMNGVRAFIYPEGESPGNLPYQLRHKPWMDGVYQVPFVFDRPGAWHIQVFLFDYPPDPDGGGWPHETFTVRVEYPGDSTPLMPLSAALLTVGLVVAAVWGRERLVKTR